MPENMPDIMVRDMAAVVETRDDEIDRLQRSSGSFSEPGSDAGPSASIPISLPGCGAGGI